MHVTSHLLIQALYRCLLKLIEIHTNNIHVGVVFRLQNLNFVCSMTALNDYFFFKLSIPRDLVC